MKNPNHALLLVLGIAMSAEANALANGESAENSFLPENNNNATINENVNISTNSDDNETELLNALKSQGFVKKNYAAFGGWTPAN